jgi:hypothetical protein
MAQKKNNEKIQKNQGLRRRKIETKPSADIPPRPKNESAGPGAKEPSCIVKGTIRYSDKVPAAGLRVVAYDLDLRSEQLLGETRTVLKAATKQGKKDWMIENQIFFDDGLPSDRIILWLFQDCIEDFGNKAMGGLI